MSTILTLQLRHDGVTFEDVAEHIANILDCADQHTTLSFLDSVELSVVPTRNSSQNL